MLSPAISSSGILSRYFTRARRLLPCEAMMTRFLARAVMAFVHAPAVVDLNPHEIHFLQGEPKRLDCPLQHGGESDIEHVPLATEDAFRFDGFHHPFFAELHIRPSREAVLLVPGT